MKLSEFQGLYDIDINYQDNEQIEWLAFSLFTEALSEDPEKVKYFNKIKEIVTNISEISSYDTKRPKSKAANSRIMARSISFK